MDKRQLKKEIYQAIKDIQNSTTQEICMPFTLRLPKSMFTQIDESRKKRPGKISRNQWIIEVIQNGLSENN